MPSEVLMEPVASHEPESMPAAADVTMKELLALNHGIDPAKVEESQTILLPAGRLSARDREILQGALPRLVQAHMVHVQGPPWAAFACSCPMGPALEH